VLYFIINLTQLERIKTEQKQERYGCSKVQGPSCRDWKLPGALLRKDRSIYIIMYKNPGIYMQKVQGGWNLENLIVSGGLSKDSPRLTNLFIDYKKP
jgi:hypothetical protein